MMRHNSNVVHVYMMQGDRKVLVGRLAWKERRVFFEYHTDFIKTGLELSPMKLPLKSGVMVCKDRLFDGLFGVFNDSLPDGWGRLLLDRNLMQRNINPCDLSPLDRLCYVGARGMGALIYEPEIKNISLSQYKNLDEIANEIVQFQENDEGRFVDDLLAMNGSSAGARPKIMRIIDGEEWMIKFRSTLDPKDIGPLEYAYHMMAKAAQLDVPEAKIFPAKKGPGYFGVKRFDHIAGKRLHMHTISGLLHIDHRMPSLDYETIMKATLWLTKDLRACEKQFRVAVFNIVSHNRDDHAKNFSFIMTEKGAWQVSPAYDLTFSSGPTGEHCTMIMGEGKNPTLAHLLQLAEVGGIKKQKALQIIEEVKSAVSQWTEYAQEAGVQTVSLTSVQHAINQLIRVC